MAARVRERWKPLTLCVLAAVSAALLAGCSSTEPRSMSKTKRSKEYFAESIWGVKASPRVSSLRSNLPRGGGRDQLGKPYKVRGKWYYPKEDPGYRKSGKASWYGDAFHGRLTANGEIYDMTHLTAAHPTMPLPSYARVTNKANGHSVIVRVNDRGPYSHGRIIDLSRRAAEMLDYTQEGTAPVEVEYVGRAPLHGRDASYLMASYRPGGRVPDPSSDGLADGVMIALGGSTPSGRSRPAAGLPRELVSAPAPTGMGIADRVELPDVGPVAPERPVIDVETLIASAALGYAPAPPASAGDALAAVEDLAVSGEQIAAGTFARRDEAQALADQLSPFGTATVAASGDDADFVVILRSDGRFSADALLRAAWANGAPEAFALRD